MQYWDTSALLKLYAREPDSEYFRNLILTSSAPAATSAIAETEIAAALLRKESDGQLSTGTAELLLARFRLDCAQERIRLIPYSPIVALNSERLARLALKQIPRLIVRSLDLIHAASASHVGAVSFVATDSRLREIVALAGIPVIPA